MKDWLEQRLLDVTQVKQPSGCKEMLHGEFIIKNNIVILLMMEKQCSRETSEKSKS